MERVDYFNNLLHIAWIDLHLTDQVNARCEGFNRTIQEEFVDCDDLCRNLSNFKNQFLDYLLWFNSKKLHFCLNGNLH